MITEKSKGMNDAHIAKETVRTLTFLAPGIGDDITTVAIDYPPYIKPDIISHKDAIEETKANKSDTRVFQNWWQSARI